MRWDHDALFRYTFAQREPARALLARSLPAAAMAALDWSTLRLLPGTSVDEALRDRHSDLLFEVAAAGAPVWLYVLVEHKSHRDPLLPWQLLRYAVRTIDRHLQQHGSARLPPLLPLVVHHGPEPWLAAPSVRQMVDLDRLPEPLRALLAPLQVDLGYLLDDLAVAPPPASQDGPPLALLTTALLQAVGSGELPTPAAAVLRFGDLFRRLWAAETGRQDLYAVFSYLAAHLEAPPEQLAAAGALLDPEASTMGKTIAEQCREEGHRAGRRAGRAELLAELLAQRFGPLPAAACNRLRSADEPTLQRIAEQLLRAATLDEALR